MGNLQRGTMANAAFAGQMSGHKKTRVGGFDRSSGLTSNGGMGALE
jgi:hypothetical protein